MTTAHIAPRDAARDGLSGWHVLTILVAFFAVVFAVNGVFLYAALSTHTGVVAIEPYRMGLHYNTRIEADAAQDRLGWTIDVADLAVAHAVSVAVRDRSGAPVTGLHLSAILGRPSTARYDTKLVLEETSPGTYAAPAAGAEPGTWVLDLEARRERGDDVFRARRRLWLKP